MHLSSEDSRVIQQSFFSIESQFGVLADRFYNNLFQARPDFRPMFPEELAGQKNKLISSLSIVINGCDQLESILPLLQELGDKHVSYGVKVADYNDVGQALILALNTTKGDSWSDELEQTWVRAYATIAAAMNGNSE